MDNTLFFPIDSPYGIAYRKDSPEYPVGPHAHDGVEIYISLTALPDVLLGDRVYAVPVDTLIIIPPFCVHQLYHETGIVYERYVLNIQDTWLKNVLYGLSNVLPSLLPNSEPQMFELTSRKGGAFKESLTESIQPLLSSSHPTDPGSLSVLFRLLSLITDYAHSLSKARTTLPISPSQKKVNEIISYIQSRISADVRISDLADHFYMNPDYLARLFKRHTHIALGQYITMQRITKAQLLLREGRSVAAVSEVLGYSDYAYFFKTFQKVTGISPSRYRAKYCGQ